MDAEVTPKEIPKNPGRPVAQAYAGPRAVAEHGAVALVPQVKAEISGITGEGTPSWE